MDTHLRCSVATFPQGRWSSEELISSILMHVERVAVVRSSMTSRYPRVSYGCKVLNFLFTWCLPYHLGVVDGGNWGALSRDQIS